MVRTRCGEEHGGKPCGVAVGKWKEEIADCACPGCRTIRELWRQGLTVADYEALGYSILTAESSILIACRRIIGSR